MNIENSDLLKLPLRYHLGARALRGNELEASKIVTSAEQLHSHYVLALIRHEAFILLKFGQEIWHKKIPQVGFQDLPNILRLGFPIYQALFCKLV